MNKAMAKRGSIHKVSTWVSFCKPHTSWPRQNLLLLCTDSLPNDKFSDSSKLKAFADDKINVT